jgi:ketosteroid isomerase-like protein
VTLLRHAYDAFNKEGVRGFEQLLAPRIELLERPRDVHHRRVDRDEAMARMEHLGWHTWHLEPQDFVVFDDRVVVPLLELNKDTTDGAPAERRRVHYWRIGPDGRANRLEVHRKRAGAVNAAAGYFALLDRLHERLRPRTYVEIGVHMGRSIGRVHPDTISIGIDPEPNIVDPTVEGVSKIYRVTSDDFFRDYDLREELGGLPLDMAFIDGMHLFEFALRDFMNLERFCTPNSVIMLHDCYPRERSHAERDRQTVAWCGDVWKVIPCLRDLRPELNVAAIDVRPEGMGIITGLDPESTVLWDSYDEIEAKYMAMDYDWVEEDQPNRLARLEHDWELIEQRLPPPFQEAPEPVGEPAA